MGQVSETDAAVTVIAGLSNPAYYVKNNQAAHFEQVPRAGEDSNTSWYKPDGTFNYPPNNGAVPGTEVNMTLKLGDTLGRYGNIGEKSNFTTQTGADASKLALPPKTNPAIYVYSEVRMRLGEVTCDSLFFSEGTDNSAKGTYIFNKNGEYHIIFTEKGKIRSDIVTNEKREVLWNAVQIISTNIIMNFAICNREKGKDFRRVLFSKEKEIFSLFGNDFEKRKNEEIEAILKKIRIMIFKLGSIPKFVRILFQAV